MYRAGYDAVLVGESLVKAADPGVFIQQMRGMLPFQPRPPAIKICGLTDPHTAAHAAKAGAHFVGIVFAKGSKRFVGSVDRASEVSKAAAAEGAEAWGVFTEQSADEIIDIVNTAQLKGVQLHGDGCRAAFAEIDARLPPTVRRVYVCSVSEDGHVSHELPPAVKASLQKHRDYVLYDGVRPGAGTPFEWELFHPDRELPFFLAGGLAPENVAEALAQVHPTGVDVSSGVEETPGCGRKDPARMVSFIEAVRTAKASPTAVQAPTVCANGLT
mmetsp:Transcript_45428/g.128188  ORF Transcript_45428/g.128188 Transcript_45428/m.128188 type:complete len:272 (+) Transcript_45428:263-1078(+)